MSDNHRSPWLLLGVDYGCTKEEASRGFAAASRRLRRSGDDRVSLDDLTWALNELEAADAGAFDAVDHFRVPADPAAYEPPEQSTIGLLAPPRPEPERVTPHSGSADRRTAAELILRGVCERLLASPPPLTCPYDVLPVAPQRGAPPPPPPPPVRRTQ